MAPKEHEPLITEAKLTSSPEPTPDDRLVDGDDVAVLEREGVSCVLDDGDMEADAVTVVEMVGEADTVEDGDVSDLTTSTLKVP